MLTKELTASHAPRPRPAVDLSAFENPQGAFLWHMCLLSLKFPAFLLARQDLPLPWRVSAFHTGRLRCALALTSQTHVI